MKEDEILILDATGVLAGGLPYLPGNPDCGAFYDVEDLPSKENIREAIKALPQNLVYGDFASILYRAFADLGIPTKLLPII